MGLLPSVFTEKRVPPLPPRDPHFLSLALRREHQRLLTLSLTA
jgi:hypothetical protein